MEFCPTSLLRVLILVRLRVKIGLVGLMLSHVHQASGFPDKKFILASSSQHNCMLLGGFCQEKKKKRTKREK